MPKPKICVSIASTTLDGALRTIDLLKPHEPDLVEIRLDYLEEVEGLTMLREASPYPLIATCRRAGYGGHFRGPERMRLDLLRMACEKGFDYIDIEISTPGIWDIMRELKDRGVKTLVSYHDPRGTPSLKALRRILRKGLSLQSDILKIVGTATRYEDNYAYLHLVLENRDLGLVSFGMGRLGVPSRVLSPLMGGSFTYASAVEGSECAPGQLSIAALREIYRLMGVYFG